MRLATSYKVRNQTLNQYISIPSPTERDLLMVSNHITWIEGRDSPVVKVIES